MVGLAAFGAMNTVLGSGGRIAAERAVGWNRQLRPTPLSTRTYFRVKVATAYVIGILTIALLYVAGATLGVHLQAGNWVAMTGLMLVGLAPFAARGILLGHLLTSDSIGPAIGGTTAVFALLGGTWFPITASHVGLGGQGWGTTGWIVVAAWTVGAALLARHAYARHAARLARLISAGRG